MREAALNAVTLRQDGRLVIFHDHDIVIELMGIYHVMEKVVSSKRSLFHLDKQIRKMAFSSNWQEGVIRPLHAGQNLVKYLGRNIDGLRDQFPGKEFHPLIELFGKYSQEMYLCWTMPTQVSCDRLNKLVDAMRADARMKAFKGSRDKHLRLSRDSTKALLNKVDELFRRVSRTNVVLLMLSYHVDETMFAEMPPTAVQNRISEHDARSHRVAFFKYLKHEYRVPLQTYAWKEEYGRFTSYHYHVLLFFDARVSRAGYVIGNEIGRHWENVITQGRGRFHNCNADRYPEHGIDVINHYDVDKIRALKGRVIPYITKSDHFIRLLTKGRIFQTGGLPPQLKRGRGRPRKHSPRSTGGVKDGVS